MIQAIFPTPLGFYDLVEPFKKSELEYFSSLGFSPTHETTVLGLKNNIFNRILGKHFKYSRIKLQRDKYDVNTCARWVLARCYFQSA